MQEATKDMGIDDQSSHPELCSDVADGVTRNIVCLFREPDAGNPPVRFDEREQETEPSQTGLRWRGESHVKKNPPGDYSHCACSRLYYSLRRVSPLDSVNWGSHNPKVGGSNPPPATNGVAGLIGW